MNLSVISILADFIFGDLSYHVFLFEFLRLEQWLCGCVRVVINIGDFCFEVKLHVVAI